MNEYAAVGADLRNTNITPTPIVNDHFQLREAVRTDLHALLVVENACFTSDKLSERSFRRHIQSDRSDLMVCEHLDPASQEIKIVGYALSFRHKGTRLARLYSIAILPALGGCGLGKMLLNMIEDLAAKNGRIFMRLEVSKSNTSAIAFYKKQGYKIFGEYSEYYEDKADALRMQKTIRHLESGGISRITPWFFQTTEFTCGPASLMMAMSSLDNNLPCSQLLELSIWREATTIFMTSGHGGCHPFGLALSAKSRGFAAEVVVNTESPLFVDGVRSLEKKNVLKVVHEAFRENCFQQGVMIRYQDVVLETIEAWLKEGAAVLVLISTYRLDGKKAPHWVVVTGIDEVCLYVHDPDVDEKTQDPIDCQHVPIARDDFNKMAAFGASRLRSAVAIRRESHQLKH